VLADATIEGTVVDDKGAPVAEAAVDARPGFGTMIFAPGADDVSDSHGHFTLGPLPDASYSVSAEWPGVGRENMYMRHDGVDAKPGQHDVRVVLPAAGTITGVVTVGGKPLAHYALALDEHGYFSFSIATVVDAGDGRFTRSGVPPKTWRVGIVGDDTEVKVIEGVHVDPGQTTDLGTIDLSAARHIHGRVVDSAGAPVAGADVLAGAVLIAGTIASDEDPLRDAMRFSRHVTTDAGGRFDVALPGAMARRVPQKVMALGADGVRSPEVVVPDGDADIVLQLAPSGTITGVVRGGTGRVTGMVNVIARGDAGHGFAMPDDRGTYRIEGLAPGHYTVSAMHTSPMQSTAPVDVDVAAGATATADLAFPTDGVTLVVLGAHGGGEHCFVGLAYGDPTDKNATAAGAAPCADRVELPNIAPGAYKLCVNEACRDVTVAATPLEQTIDLSATR
jgi:protocatechuate 3,4-dioxygenase beta subunit